MTFAVWPAVFRATGIFLSVFEDLINIDCQDHLNSEFRDLLRKSGFEFRILSENLESRIEIRFENLASNILL